MVKITAILSKYADSDKTLVLKQIAEQTFVRALPMHLIRIAREIDVSLQRNGSPVSSMTLEKNQKPGMRGLRERTQVGGLLKKNANKANSQLEKGGEKETGIIIPLLWNLRGQCRRQSLKSQLPQCLSFLSYWDLDS